LIFITFREVSPPGTLVVTEAQSLPVNSDEQNVHTVKTEPQIQQVIEQHIEPPNASEQSREQTRTLRQIKAERVTNDQLNEQARTDESPGKYL
jgi:hypothetical protein